MGFFSSIAAHIKPPAVFKATFDQAPKYLSSGLKTDSANIMDNIAHRLNPDQYVSRHAIDATQKALSHSGESIHLAARYDAHEVSQAAQKLGDVTINQAIYAAGAPVRAVKHGARMIADSTVQAARQVTVAANAAFENAALKIDLAGAAIAAIPERTAAAVTRVGNMTIKEAVYAAGAPVRTAGQILGEAAQVPAKAVQASRRSLADIFFGWARRLAPGA